MTTPTRTPADIVIDALVDGPPADLAATHRLVDQLIAAGLPTPRGRTVREDLDEIALSLTLVTLDDLDAWNAQLTSIGAVADGPWHVGPVAYRVRVGRLAGVRTVLAARIPVDELVADEPGVAVGADPAATGDQPRDPATTSTAESLGARLDRARATYDLPRRNASRIADLADAVSPHGGAPTGSGL